MIDHSLVNVVATEQKVYDFLTWLESAHDVSIKFWLSVEKYGSGPPVFWVYAAGSGPVFDHPRFAGVVHRSRVLSAMENSLLEAVFQVLIQLDAEISALVVPRTARPVL